LVKNGRHVEGAGAFSVLHLQSPGGKF